MSSSTSHASYEDCFRVFDEAMQQPNGIRIEVSDEGAGMQLRTRLHFSRQMDRDNNRRLYEATDERYGVSPYDSLIIREPKFLDEKWWVYIEPRKINGRIEAL
jgi:hypothetical protein